MASSPPERAADGRGLEHDLLSALAHDDTERATSAARALGDRRFFRGLSAMLAASVEHVWPDGVSREARPRISRGIADQLAGEATVAPALIEASIRAALGEGDQIDGIPAQELVPAYLLIVKTTVLTEITDQSGREALTSTAMEILGSA